MGIILPIGFHIFQRGRYTTNQIIWLYIQLFIVIYLYIYNTYAVDGVMDTKNWTGCQPMRSHASPMFVNVAQLQTRVFFKWGTP